MTSAMRWMTVPVLVGLVACSAKTLSGTYMARDGHGAALLQITENQNQQVMGSMVVIHIKQDGQAERVDISIAGGAVDVNGRSLTLVMKGNELLSQEKNVSGLVTGNGIDLAMPGGTAHFSRATPQEFDAATSVLVEAGKQQQQWRNQAEQLAEDKRTFASLAHDLSAYNAHVEGLPACNGAFVSACRDLHIKPTLFCINLVHATGRLRRLV